MPIAFVRVTALLVLILVVNVTALLKGGFKIVGDSVNTQHHSFYERQSMVVKVFLPVVLNCQGTDYLFQRQGFSLSLSAMSRMCLFSMSSHFTRESPRHDP